MKTTIISFARRDALRSEAARIIPILGNRFGCRRSLLVLSLCLMRFAFAPAASAQGTFTYQQLKSFGSPAPGGNSRAGLVQGRDGALYGTASEGGSSGNGTIFRVQPDGSGFTVLKHFDGTTGGSPQAGLIQGADGALYGTTTFGGSNGGGTVFKLNPDGTGFTVLKNLHSSTSGGSPVSGLIQGLDGALYGTTTSGGGNGGGTVFKLNPDGADFTVLKHFDNSPSNGSPSTSGGSPRAGLIQGQDGALYGTATYGGSSGGGTIFKLNPDGSGFTILKNLNLSTTGGNPHATLMQEADGTLYGTASRGGPDGYGTVFRLSPSGTDFTVLKSFGDSETGRHPLGGVIQGTDGALYGTTSAGRSLFLHVSRNIGTVFKLNRDGTDFIVLQGFLSIANDFVGLAETGLSPCAGLIQGLDGALYGTASRGGSQRGGTVFKLTAAGTGFTVLRRLSNGPDMAEHGGYPYGRLIQGLDGMLYGTTSEGGSYGHGTIFKSNPEGTSVTIIKDFDSSTTGAGQYASLLQDTNGTLYGTTSSDVSTGILGGNKTLFRLNSDGTGFSVVQNLAGGGFTYPEAGLINGPDGALYGTTSSDVPYGGSAANGGTVFKLNIDGTGFTVLREFDYDTAGGLAGARLLQGSDGVLYGTATYGGSGTAGTLFKMNPDGTGLTVLINLNYVTTGVYPHAGLIEGSDLALYGTTSWGGSAGHGTVFKLNRDGSDFTILQNFDNATAGSAPHGELLQGADGALYGTALNGGTYGYGTAFRLTPGGTSFTVLLNFDKETSGAYPRGGLIQATDGAFYGTTVRGGDFDAGTLFRLVPAITLSPVSVVSGSGAFTLTVEGFAFAPGAVVQWNGTDLTTTFVSSSELTAAVPASYVLTTPDIYSVLITIKSPDDTVSSPEVFVVTAANVAEVQSEVAGHGQSVSVSTAPIGTGNTAGISATLANSGDSDPVTVTAAIYSSNPSPSTAFEIDSATGVAGEFLDLQVTGADEADTVSAYFYYPMEAVESETSPTLKYYDGSAWVDVFSSGGLAPGKDMSDNLDGTISGGRFVVQFDTTSTPGITELGGTFFAVTYPRPPLAFAGFLAPIGGADATGGSFAQPVQTFKAGSTIPVRFTASRDGVAIVTGAHTLQGSKYSSETTADTPIDATPQGKATTGNRFELHGSQWHFNLDTKASGLTNGIWQLVATLSDGTQHRVWIQIK